MSTLLALYLELHCIYLTSWYLKCLAELFGPGTSRNQNRQVGLLDHLINGSLYYSGLIGELLSFWVYLELGWFDNSDFHLSEWIVNLWCALHSNIDLFLSQIASLVVNLKYRVSKVIRRKLQGLLDVIYFLTYTQAATGLCVAFNMCQLDILSFLGQRHTHTAKGTNH